MENQEREKPIIAALSVLYMNPKTLYSLGEIRKKEFVNAIEYERKTLDYCKKKLEAAG